jgi:cysteine synthase A
MQYVPALHASSYAAEGVLATVGNTPLVHLKQLYPNTGINFYGKSEYLNPGGSIKDRTALNILLKALREGKIRRGDTIIESSSGNMAIGLAQTCLYYKLKLIVVVDPKLNEQTANILRTYGVTINRVHQPHPTEGYLGARLARVQELLKTVPRSFWTNQYGNPNNPKTHEHTLREITEQLDRPLDYLFVATSTCGTLMGCAKYIRDHQLSTKLVAVDALGSVIFGTPAGKRLIPGHGAGRPSQFLKREWIHDVVHVNDQDCIDGCHRLLNREALLCGGSSGAIVSAVGKYVKNIAAGATCGLILCDRGERYLDTIYNENWVSKNFHLPQLKRA